MKKINCILFLVFFITSFAVGQGYEKYHSIKTDYEIAVFDTTIYDSSRYVELGLHITYPQKTETIRAFPVLIISPGIFLEPESYDFLAESWGKSGYITIGVEHPDTTGNMYSSILGFIKKVDYLKENYGRYDDIDYLIEELLWNRINKIRGYVDITRIGVIGHGAGARTMAVNAGINLYKKDKVVESYNFKVKAAMLVSTPGVGKFGISRASWDSLKTPVMFVTGTNDFSVGITNERDRRSAYEAVHGVPKYLAYIEGATKQSFCDIGQSGYRYVKSNTTHQDWYIQFSTAFWDYYLKGREAAKNWLNSGTIERRTYGACTIEHEE